MEELEELQNKIIPLIKKGQSPYAAIQATKDEVNITERSLYRYIEVQLIDVSALDLPRKARRKVRKNHKAVIKDKINRDGRTFQDFKNLPESDRNRVVQMDSVEGFK